MTCGWRSLRNALKCSTPACVAESWIRWPPAWLIQSKRCFSTRERCSDAWFRFRRSPQCSCSIPGSSARWRPAAFNQRRAECEEAAKRLGVQALRDIDIDELVESWTSSSNHYAGARAMLSPKTRRVLQAVDCGDAGEVRRADECVARELARRLRRIGARARSIGGVAASRFARFMEHG